MMKIDKPWGYELVWAFFTEREDVGYIGKIIHINKGHSLSFQFHKKKTETIFVKEGTLTFYSEGHIANRCSGTSKKIIKGSTIHIPAGLTHRFIAEECDVELLEVSTPQMNDVVRMKDDYGR